MQAKRFEECGALNERIDRMKNAQTEISRLQTELHGAMAARDFKACSEIQGDIDILQEMFEALKVRLQFTPFTWFPYMPSVDGAHAGSNRWALGKFPPPSERLGVNFQRTKPSNNLRVYCQSKDPGPPMALKLTSMDTKVILAATQA